MKLLADISLEGEWASDETLEALIKDVIRCELRQKVRDVIKTDTNLRKRIKDMADKIVSKAI